MAMAVLHIQDDVRNDIISEKEGLEIAKTICREAVLKGRLNKVEALRVDSSENIPELVSYVSAVRLLRAVEERRCSDGQ